jgi:hypothetical protein
MALTDFANVVISTEGPALTQVGFGTLLIAGYHTKYAALVREYTDLAGLVSDGFTVNDPIYKAAQRAFGQAPRPNTVKVGKLANAPVQVVKFGLNGAAQASTLYGFTMTRNGVVADITFTSDASPLASEIVAGLAAAVEASALGAAVAAVTADTNTTCQITEGTAGTQVYFSNWTDNLTFSDLTPDPGIAADLAAIRLYDADWYGLALAHNFKASIVAAAAYVETLDALFFYNSSDSASFDPASTTDTFYLLKNSAYGRSVGAFDLDDTGGYAGVGMAAERFPFDPGQDGAGGTFHAKTLVGVSADKLTPTRKSALLAKNATIYITTAARNHTLGGKVAGGEWADVVRGLDWFRIRTEERIAAAILNNDKIPYTDRGISIILSEVLAQGATAEAVELFRPGSFVATAPKASATSSADRAARKLTGVKFSATLAGAIHLVDPISGVVSN